ncbi:NAD dependent epimerase/dehydratase family protein [Novosphingobium sp. Rr 2-17]|uniref:hypothetical protein n=1 Tax=Novosphingobium sp. Rr 2-17 TaxID=555793 RepID=UPI000269AB23|nr:hypothetical protein [Novosphingobium sp. Rr 2-17]EIZ79622.1 NAD dependent epimerase/dehydratase family protein [Novosphingobium sp. Rr 2-17]
MLTLAQLSTRLAKVAGLIDTQVSSGEYAPGFTVRDWFPFRDYPCLADPTRLIKDTTWRPQENLDARFRKTYHTLSSAGLISEPRVSKAERFLLDRLRVLPI